MDTTSIVILFASALCASFIQRVTGFGFGIFIMTILPHILPSYGESTALSGMLAIITVTLTAIQTARVVPWKKLLPLLLTFLVVSALSVSTVSRVDSHIMKKILGGILIFVSVWFFFISGRIRVKPTIPIQVGLGTVSGFMGGFFAMQGPPAVIYFISCTDDKKEYLALTSWFFMIGNLMMTIYRAGNGFVTDAVLKSWCYGLPAVLVGFAAGSLVYSKMNIGVIRKVVYAYMAVAGVIALVTG